MPLKRIARLLKAGKKSPSLQKSQKIFPFAPEIKSKKWGNITIKHYADGSRLYLLGDGNFVAATPDGVKKHLEDPKARKRFFNNPQQHLSAGGNSDIYLTTASEQPVVVKVHHNGISPLGQLGNMRHIRKVFNQSKRAEHAPTYFAAGEVRDPKTNRKVRFSAMEHMRGTKAELLLERLDKSTSKEDHKLARQLRIEYNKFEKRIRKYLIDLTDFHAGNVLVEYDQKRKKFSFTLIDQ